MADPEELQGAPELLSAGIDALRLRLGAATQRELAGKLGLSPVELTYFKRLTRIPSGDKRARLEAALTEVLSPGALAAVQALWDGRRAEAAARARGTAQEAALTRHVLRAEPLEPWRGRLYDCLQLQDGAIRALRATDLVGQFRFGSPYLDDPDELPPYVPRDVDSSLEAAVFEAIAESTPARSRFVLLVGEPKTGKTRAILEALRATIPSADLLVPIHPGDRPEARLREFTEAYTDAVIPNAETGAARLPPRDRVVFLDDLHQWFRPDAPTTPNFSWALAQLGPDRDHSLGVRAETSTTVVVATAHPWLLQSELLAPDDRELFAAHHLVLSSQLSDEERRRAEEVYGHLEARVDTGAAPLSTLPATLAGVPSLRTSIDAVLAGSPPDHPEHAMRLHRQAMVRALTTAAIVAPGGLAERDLLDLAEAHFVADQQRRPRAAAMDAALDWAATPLLARTGWAIATAYDGGEVDEYALNDALAKSTVRWASPTRDWEPPGWLTEWIQARDDDYVRIYLTRCFADWLAQNAQANRAVDLFNDVLTWELAELGSSHPASIATQEGLASALMQRGDSEQAVAIYERLVTAQSESYGPDSLEAADSISLLSGALLATGQVSLAIELLEPVIARQRSLLGTEHGAWRSSTYFLGIALALDGSLAEALALFRELYEIERGLLGPTHTDTLLTLQQIEQLTSALGEEPLPEVATMASHFEALLGKQHHTALGARRSEAHALATHDLATAIRDLDAVAAEFAATLGVGHQETLMTRAILAGLLGEHDGAPAAIQALADVLDEHERGGSPGTLLELFARSSYASWLAADEQFALAAEVAAELLGTHLRSLQPRHPQVIAMRRVLARSLRLSGRPAEAEPHYRTLLELDESQGDIDVEQLTGTRQGLASCLDALGSDDEAIELLMSVVDGTESTEELLAPLRQLSTLLRRNGRDDEASATLARRTEASRTSRGPTDPYTLMCVLDQAHHEADRDGFELASAWARSVLDVQLEADGPSAASVGTAHPLIYWMLRSERFAEAAELGRTTLEQARSVLGPDEPTTLAVAQNLAHALVGAGALDEAVVVASDLLEQRRLTLGAGARPTLEIAKSLAQWLVRAQRVPDALEVIGAAFAEATIDPGPDDWFTLLLADLHAQVAAKAGDHPRAVEIASDALVRRQRTMGRDDHRTLSCAYFLTQFLRDSGDHEAALALAEDTVERFRIVLGSDHVETIAAIELLADLVSNQGDHARSASLWIEAIDWRMQDANSPRGVSGLISLVRELRTIGAYEAAARYQLTALEATKVIFGMDHTSTWTIMRTTALYLADAGQYQAAISLAEEALRLRRDGLGPEHPETLIVEHDLAAHHARLGDTHRSVELLEDLLPRQRAALGANHADVLSTAHDLAGAYLQLRRYDVAEPLARDTLERRAGSAGLDDPETVHTRTTLARLLGETQRYDEAIGHLADVLALRNERAGRTADSTLVTLHQIAYWQCEAHRYDESIATYGELLERRLEITSSDHPDALTTSYCIAITAERAGRTELASELFIEVWRTRLEVLGPDHPDTVLVGEAARRYRDG